MANIVYDGSKDKRLFKDVLADTISRMLNKDPDIIYLDADLMRCIGMFDYAREHRDRAIDVGIAEANMIGIASGLAASGFKPICHSFGVFASRRCFDQVFLSAGYGRNDITVIGSDPGVCASFNGGTHMPFEDMALYRAIPGSTVLEITDSVMLEDLLEQLPDREGVKYIRVGRKNNAAVYEKGSRFTIGKAEHLREGKDVTLIASGIMVHEALKAADKLLSDGISAQVLDMFSVKPIDADAIVESAKITGAIVTCENHNRVGGLSDAVSAVLLEKCPTVLETVAVKESFGEVGPQDYLQERFGLTSENIYQKALKAIRRKAETK